MLQVVKYYILNYYNTFIYLDEHSYIYIYIFFKDRVIAMSFPSSGMMSFYRNPIKV